MAQVTKSKIWLSFDSDSPIGVRHIGDKIVSRALGKFPLANTSGLGAALHKANVSQSDVRRLYAWIRSLD